MLLKLAYLGLSLLMTFLLIFIGSHAIRKTFSDPGKIKKKLTLLVALLLGWHVYVFITSTSGILMDLSFPPRFVLFLIVPAFIFTGIFVYKNRNQNWLQNIPSQWLIYYQSFRVFIETIFVFSVAQGILHKEVTIEGYNYDKVFAFTALIIGFLFQKNFIGKRGAILWNYLGLAVIAVILFLFQTTIYFPEWYDSKTALMPLAAVKYPYILVAGFLMPSAVFVHLLSIVQLRKAGR